jgi:opacity protein-like surface antigen
MLSTRHFSALISSLLFSTTALAGEGFYMGAGVGYGTLDTKVRVHEIAPNALVPTNTVSQEYDESKGKAVGQVHGGYEWIFLTQSMTFSVAAEAFVDFQSRDFNSSTVVVPNPLFPNEKITKFTKFTVDNTYGLSIKPGIFISNNIMTYLDIGVVYMQFKDIETDLVEYSNKNLYGLRTGVGIQWLVTKDFSIDLSWAIDSYDEFHEAEVASGEGTSSQVDEQIFFESISNNRFLLDFNYYFDFQ